jgi:enoyl-CoA hydratase/carnithine racemase
MDVDLGTPYLRWTVDAGIATCTIDRPERRNAMTGSMYLGVRTAVGVLNQSPAVHALIITGAGDTFCPGGDMSRGGDENPGLGAAVTAFGNNITPYEGIRRSAKPVVAAINGACQGGGLLTALTCDVAIASDRATFRVPEVLRGVADTNFAAYLPAHVGVAHARDLILTGRRFDAAEAFALGVVSRIAPHDQLAQAARTAAVELVRGAPEARRVMKRIINDRYGDVDSMALDASNNGPDVREGFAAFVEHRAPAWIPDGFAPDGRL